MKRYIVTLCLFPFFLSACGNVSSPLNVTVPLYSTPWVTYTPSPYPGAIVATPTLVTGEQPPTCTFPLAHTQPATSAPEDYIFSAPQEPLPPDDRFSEIVEWLPDNQRVLLVESFDDVRTGEYKQNIELLNPQTGETQIYGSRQPGGGLHYLPAWMPGLNAVVYPETRLLKSTQKDGMNLAPYEFEQQLWVSRGDPGNAQLIEKAHLTADGMSDFSVVVRPGGAQIVYRTQVDNQLSKRNGSLAAQPPVAFDPSHWDYRGSRGPLPTFRASYVMAWRPGTPQIFLYTYGGPDMGYTLLLDTNSGQVCELNMHGWALLGRWSSDGRFLSIVRVQEPSFPVNATDLTVLDTATGQLYAMDVAPQGGVGTHYASGISWAPDNRHLLVLGSVMSYQGCSPNCYDTRLYLVDFLTGQVNPILPANQFTANDPVTNLAWSPDGSKVLALCPNICLISVQKSDP